MTSHEERMEVEELLDEIEENGWAVLDYDVDLDPFDHTYLTVDLEKVSQ